MEERQREFHFQLLAHPTLLSDDLNAQRYVDVYFCIPSSGIDKDTGFLLLIPGFGGHALSRVYQKMRRVFADTYNLVTIQCAYLGSEFMQTPKPEEVPGLLALATPQSIPQKVVRVDVPLDESLNNYVDMGPIQTIDCLSAVLATKAVLDDNGYQLNWGRGIVYGHSHGAYLAHMCNLFAPGLFHLVIDNSAWLVPAYLDSPRYATFRLGEQTVHVCYDYLVRRQGVPDRQLYELTSLYGKLGNQAHLVLYQGIHDHLVDYRAKAAFARKVYRSQFRLITPAEVDGKAFRSTGHGLDSDHLKLFHHAYELTDWRFPTRRNVHLTRVRFRTRQAHYTITYENGVPSLSVVA